VSFLTSLPAPLLAGALTGACVLFAWVLNKWLHSRYPAGKGASYGITAAAYMTALGSLFAILTGFLINTAYLGVRSAEDIVAKEAAAANRLAWGARGLPSADVSLIQQDLAAYLAALELKEWPELGGNEPVSGASDELNELQKQIFTVGARGYAPQISVDSMQAAVEELGGQRRARITAASAEIPFELFALSVIAGLALIGNAIIVTLKNGPRDGIVTIGIVVVVGLDLALILALSGPFNGPFEVGVDPLTGLLEEIRSGEYLPWSGAR
jgi:hypothetical protein